MVHLHSIPSLRRLAPVLTAALVALGATALVGTARADAVPMPPEDCMEGTIGGSCHGGIYCHARDCTDGSQCDTGELCEDRELCVGQIDCTGGWDPDAGPFYSSTVEGSCEGGAACSSGTCQTVKVCVSPPTTSSGGGTTSGGSSGGATEVDQGCGCRLGARPSHAAWWPLLGLPILLGARRRR